MPTVLAPETLPPQMTMHSQFPMSPLETMDNAGLVWKTDKAAGGGISRISDRQLLLFDLLPHSVREAMACQTKAITIQHRNVPVAEVQETRTHDVTGKLFHD